MTSRTGNRGFTLIEVLVATVILFAGLGAVLKAYSVAVAAVAATDDSLAASDLLAERAALMERRLGWPTGPVALPNRVMRDGVVYLCEDRVAQAGVTTNLAVATASLRLVRLNGLKSYTLDCEWVVFRDWEGGR